MPVFPTYTIIRHSTWEHNKGARMLALRQKDAYDNKRADLLADSGARRVSTQMVSKAAAEAASKISTTSGPTAASYHQGSRLSWQEGPPLSPSHSKGLLQP
jgi:hypothetical protein